MCLSEIKIPVTSTADVLEYLWISKLNDDYKKALKDNPDIKYIEETKLPQVLDAKKTEFTNDDFSNLKKVIKKDLDEVIYDHPLLSNQGRNLMEVANRHADFLQSFASLDDDKDTLSKKEIFYAQYLMNNSDPKVVSMMHYMITQKDVYHTSKAKPFQGRYFVQGKPGIKVDMDYIAENLTEIAKHGAVFLFDQDQSALNGVAKTVRVSSFDDFTPNQAKIVNLPSGNRGDCGITYVDQTRYLK